MTSKTVDRKKPVATAGRDSTAAEIAGIMEEHNVGSVVITDDDKVVGIVTDRDLAIAIGTSSLTSEELVTEDIMRSPVTTIPAGSSLLQVIQTMGSADVRRLPVVDENDQLVDIVTFDDIVGVLAECIGALEHVIDQESPSKISDFA